MYDDTLSLVYDIISREPSLVYVSIGSAVHAAEPTGGILRLDEGMNHQYPPFIQRIKHRYPELPVVCVLIDYDLKEDPFMVKSGYVRGDTDKDNIAGLDEGWRLVHRDHNNRLKLYSDKFTKNYCVAIYDEVKYCDLFEERDNTLQDITDFLNMLAEMSVGSDGVMVFHDFTGKDFRYYSEFMYDRYRDDMNRLMIGLGCGEMNGCYPDLTAVMYMVDIDYDDDKLTLMNPAQLAMKDMIKNVLMSNDYSETFREQMRCYVHSKIDTFISVMLTVYRRASLIRQGKLEYEEHFMKDVNRAVGIYGKFEFTLDSVMDKTIDVLQSILRSIGREDRLYDLVGILEYCDEKDVYEAIDRVRKIMYCIV